MTSSPSGGTGRQRGLLGRLAGTVTERVVDTVDPDLVLEHVDVNALVERIDVNALLSRVDLNALLAELDLDALIDRLDVDALMLRVDADALLDRVDPDRLLDRVDPNALLDRVDPNALLDRVDPNALLDRVDPDRLLERVDVNAVVGRVDVEQVMVGVDLDALLRRVDVQAVVQRSGIPEIVADSTVSIFGSALDLARRQLVGLDAVIDRVVDRLLRRVDLDRAVGPPLLMRASTPGPDVDATAAPRRTSRVSVSGHYAGPLSRAVAATLDVLVATTLFTLGVAGLELLVDTLTSRTLGGDRSGPLAIGAFVVWAFCYVFVSVAVTGRTPGKGLTGLRVVSSEGAAPSVRQAFVRTLAFPLSAVLFGIGFLMAIVQREHRALHDLIAGTAVVFDWGDRTAEMPGPLSEFLDRAGRPPSTE